MLLEGKLLIAAPSIVDLRFGHSLVLICEHSKRGSMGLIINKPNPKLDFSLLLTRLSYHHPGEVSALKLRQLSQIRVHFGGPVDPERGFVIHSEDYPPSPETIILPGGIHVTSTLDIIEALAIGEGPHQAALFLGYAGWGAGQLEMEIARSDWLIGDTSSDFIYNGNDKQKWKCAIEMMGIDLARLSPISGNA